MISETIEDDIPIQKSMYDNPDYHCPAGYVKASDETEDFAVTQWFCRFVGTGTQVVEPDIPIQQSMHDNLNYRCPAGYAKASNGTQDTPATQWFCRFVGKKSGVSGLGAMSSATKKTLLIGGIGLCLLWLATRKW